VITCWQLRSLNQEVVDYHTRQGLKRIEHYNKHGVVIPEKVKVEVIDEVEVVKPLDDEANEVDRVD
jgi:hypothetical protein